MPKALRFPEGHNRIEKSPATGLEIPENERIGRTHLRVEEYSRMISLAEGKPTDYAILQVFLQTGVKVSEICYLRLADVDLEGRAMKVTVG